jgi:glycosyltransferase involved in cell wall biosynthesis
MLFVRRIDVVYSGSDFFPDVVPCFLYKLFHPGTKWVSACFHIYPDWKTRPGSKVRNLVAKYLQLFSLWLIRFSNVTININEDVRSYLIKKGFRKEKLEIVYPGLNCNYYMGLQVKKDTPEYDATFLARLSPSKGIFDLVEIWKGVVSEVPKATLGVIGGGGSDSVREELMAKISEAGLESVIKLLGFIEDDPAFRIIKKSKCFVFPSHEEGFGIAIAEALSCGTPVVSWNLSVYDEIFENTIVKVKENDTARFAKEVVVFISDPRKSESAGKKGQEYVQKYSWDSVAEEYYRLLTKENLVKFRI